VILAIAAIGTAVTLFPIVKRQNESIALGYVGGRIVEAIVILVGVISLLSVVTSSLAIGVNTLLLAYLMYRSRLVPRFIPVLGQRIAKLARSQFPAWGSLPSQGHLPDAECRRLVPILRAFTSTPDRCYFGVWEGFGVPELQAFAKRPRLTLPHRAYFLFPGPIDAVSSLSFGTFQQPPNLWWPEDRAWCVASEIDLTETYLAGSEACIKRVVGDPDLEAFQIALEGRVDIDGDLINI
jgi:hypothetical protein